MPGASPAAVRQALGPVAARVSEAPATLEERFFELTAAGPGTSGRGPARGRLDDEPEPPGPGRPRGRAGRRGRGQRHPGGDPGRRAPAFRRHGYDGATIRRIAADAGVDPALVHHFFGTKERLFAAAVRLPVVPGELIGAALAAGPAIRGSRASASSSS